MLRRDRGGREAELRWTAMLEPKHHSSPNFESLNVAVRTSGSAFSTFSEMTAVFQRCVIIVDAVKLKTLMSLLVEARRPLSTSE